MAKHTITVPLEITLYEPDRDEKGIVTRSSLFLIVGGGTATINGEEHPFGNAGGSLVAYLPGQRAVGIDVRQIIEAGLASANG